MPLNRLWLLGLLLLLLIAAGAFLVARVLSIGTEPASSPVEHYARVRLAGEEFSLEVAATPASRAQGLAGRNRLDDHGGMLFYFDPAERVTDRYVFWMKGMRIPIDIIWVRDGVIRGIVAGAEPPPPGAKDADIPRFAAPEPVDAAIEIRGGRAGELGLGIGQPIEFLLP